MIIERTSYVWAAKAALWRQTLTQGDIKYIVEVDRLYNDKCGVIVWYYICDTLQSVSRYCYCVLFSFVQAVKQIFDVDFGIDLEWYGKFVIE